MITHSRAVSRGVPASSRIVAETTIDAVLAVIVRVVDLDNSYRGVSRGVSRGIIRGVSRGIIRGVSRGVSRGIST